METASLGTARRSGIALVGVGALLALLLALCAAMLSAARIESVRTRAISNGGVARLRENPFPLRLPGAANRGDDWTFRDAPDADPASARRPSYDHGDGGVSSRSGRLRGEWRFSLRIESADGKIPVNDGFLDDVVRWSTASPLPSRIDTNISYHAGLAHALNNLGAILLPQGHPRRRRIETGCPSEPYVFHSWLGNDILQDRPAGGYRDLEHLRRVLARPGGGYRPGDLDRLAPYLDLSLGTPVVPYGPVWPPGSETLVPLRRIDLGTAAAPVLLSLLRYLAISIPGTALQPAYWEPGAADAADPRVGAPYSAVRRACLFPDEADRLAAALLDFRRGDGAFSWRGLYAFLAGRAESDLDVYASEQDGKIFRSGLGKAGFPVAQARLAQLKADLAFAVLCPDVHPAPSASPLAWSGWGIPRGSGGWGVFPFESLADRASIERISLPEEFPGGYSMPGGPFVEGSPAGGGFVPLVGDWKVPSRFDAECAAAAGAALSRATGRWTRHETMELTSQEDLENASGAGLAGIRAVNDPAASFSLGSVSDPFDTGRRLQGREGDGWQRQVVCLPRWPLDSYPAGRPPRGAWYSRWHGALALASREGGARGADLYWPFDERDADASEPFHSGTGSAILPPIEWRTEGMGALDPDAPHFTPLCIGAGGAAFRLAEGGATPEGMPGIGSAAGEIWDASVCGWLVPSGTWQSFFVLRSVHAEGQVGRLAIELDRDASAQPGIRIRAHFLWKDAATGEPVERVFGPFFFSDRDRPPAPVDFRFRIKRFIGAPATYLLFSADGQRHSEIVPAAFACGVEEELEIQGVDELRFYGRDLPDAEGDALRGLGRYAKEGVYVSPRYVFDVRTDIDAACFTGIVPAGLEDKVAIRVEAIGYPDPEGTGPPVWREWETSGPLQPLGIAGVRSFRYVVTFDARRVAGPLLDTPVFESIWFTFRRPGRSGRWEDWSVR